jgi:hypothetical protein
MADNCIHIQGYKHDTRNSWPARQLIFVKMKLLSNETPLLRLISTFSVCTDALQSMKEHTSIEEAIWSTVSNLWMERNEEPRDLHPPMPSSSGSTLSVVVGVSKPRVSLRTMRPRRWESVWRRSASSSVSRARLVRGLIALRLVARSNFRISKR